MNLKIQRKVGTVPVQRLVEYAGTNSAWIVEYAWNRVHKSVTTEYKCHRGCVRISVLTLTMHELWSATNATALSHFPCLCPLAHRGHAKLR
jgi:hypothetical protein